MIQAYYDDINLLIIETDRPDLRSVQINGEELELQALMQLDGISQYRLNTEVLDVDTRVSVDGEIVPVVFRGIVKTEWFMNRFDATEEKLGSWVKANKTYFAVYAPVASQMTLKLDDKRYDMLKKDNGTFYLILDENYHGASYWFEVTINGETKSTTDPYAKASLPNRGGSVVVDFKALKLDIKKYQYKHSPIILEASVRDFSMDPEVDFKNRGQFLGMLESHGNYGMNHVVDLGITHLQLMPVADFQTVDELNPFDTYNWGYDTMQFMALEGSYSSNVHDPLQAIKDFAKLVDEYHRKNIGINLDVVFNHVYEVDDHPLHILVPYYYFRYLDNFELSNGSFCGNEIASEMPMCSKLIVESAEHFVKEFKIDGYRFDLMGLLDVDTMNKVYGNCYNHNKDIMIYGEGWSMPTVLPEYKHASMINFSQMARIGHFNDRFRDTVGGKESENDLGYADGRIEFTETIKAALSAYSDSTYAFKLFDSSAQSINYVECHDNMTIADRVTKLGKGKKEGLFMMGLVILAQGIPFLQIGQSFFRNKKGDHNSYKSPDSVNRIEWALLDENKEMNDTVKKWIEIRKDMYRFSEGYSFEEDEPLLHYYHGKYKITFNPNGLVQQTAGKSINIKYN